MYPVPFYYHTGAGPSFLYLHKWKKQVQKKWGGVLNSMLANVSDLSAVKSGQNPGLCTNPLVTSSLKGEWDVKAWLRL